MISFFAFSGLFNFIVSIFLAILVYSKGKKILTNKIFALDAFSVAFWSFGYFFWQISTTESSALFWCRILMAGAIFIPIFYFHFIVVFLNLIKNLKRVIYLGYGLGLFFLLSNFTSYFVKSVGRELSFPFWPNPGIFFHPFLIMFFFFICFGWYLLIKSFQKTQEVIKKQQIKYLLLGTGIGFISGSTNYFLWYDIPVLPYLNILVSIYVLLTTFAILRYHLFEIRVILTEFFIGLAGITLLIQAFTAETLFLRILGFSLFVLFIYFGYELIKSVLREIRQREEIEKIDRAKSEFISIASHQLRTPLTAVKGYISMVLEGTYGKLSEKLSKPLENVYNSNERLIRLVNDLLNLSRLDAGKIDFSPGPASLEEMVSSIVEELKINAENKGLYMKIIKPSEPLPKIMVDQGKLRQVILNIVDNAIKYTKEGGIALELKKLNGQEEVRISDTGEGMDEKELSSLFQMFSRATAGNQLHAEGAGIGLYVARQFVGMHGGKIWAESPGKGKGSTFIIQLPIELDLKLLKEKTKIITKAADNIF
ncbi:MAG TPA: ATP-binding protein [Candidatus Humimicrobiaceae bacterium]|nr:ATP-binding protein [Candidatus Humimicrobiaceae bacterium]